MDYRAAFAGNSDQLILESRSTDYTDFAEPLKAGKSLLEALQVSKLTRYIYLPAFLILFNLNNLRIDLNAGKLLR